MVAGRRYLVKSHTELMSNPKVRLDNGYHVYDKYHREGYTCTSMPDIMYRHLRSLNKGFIVHERDNVFYTRNGGTTWYIDDWMIKPFKGKRW